MDAQKTVEMLRRIRHDFGNHLQVLNGYIDLAMYDRVKDYIGTIVEEMARERFIFESLPAESALYFYEQVLLARDLGVILVYEDFDLQSLDLLRAANEPKHSLIRLTKDLDKGSEPVVYLSVYEDNQGIDLLFDSDYEDEKPVRVRLNRE